MGGSRLVTGSLEYQYRLPLIRGAVFADTGLAANSTSHRVALWCGRRRTLARQLAPSNLILQRQFEIKITAKTFNLHWLRAEI